MASKQQLIKFVNEQGQLTARINLILEPKLNTLPLFYRVILHQPSGRILVSREKWNEWKRQVNDRQQIHFLRRNVFTYQPGAIKNADLDHRIQAILQLQQD